MGLQTGPNVLGLGGVVSAGHPLQRPAGSSIRCRNFRILPGNYLRLRAGRTLRLHIAGTSIFSQFYEWRKSNASNEISCIAEHTDGVGRKWKKVDISTPSYSLTDIYTQDTNVAPANLGAITGVRDKLFLFSGSASRSSTQSKPGLVSWDGTTVRYVGLDCLTNGGSPTASFAAGAGNNTIITWVSIWVGLYNSTTTHCGNAVFCGKLSTPGTGTITVSNLARLKSVSNNGTEAAELKFVFYASIDGGETAYQILNSTLDGPFTVAASSSTASLSITALVPQGFILDLTQAHPFENFPPRAMNQTAYANGRVYGILAQGGTATSGHLQNSDGTYYPDFSYLVVEKDNGAIVWSAAADDAVNNNFVGVPEESWPFKNKTFTPNGEVPILIDQSPGGNQLLVVTATGCFILQESADGLHQWITLSKVDGMGSPKTYVRTPRGPMWVTQRRQIVLLDANYLSLSVVSDPYAEMLNYTGSIFAPALQLVAADYLWDPRNQIDRYEVYRSDMSSIVHDFAIGGQGYEHVGQFVVSAARTVSDSFANTHHILASADIYTQEADPFFNTLATRDQKADASFIEISGDYISQWMNFGDARVKKKFSDLDVIGDGDVSAQLTMSPLAMSWFYDFATDEDILTFAKSRQSQTDQNFKARFDGKQAFWIKFRLQLAGHSQDAPTISYPSGSWSTGDLPPNFYGMLYEAAITVSDAQNRP